MATLTFAALNTTGLSLSFSAASGGGDAVKPNDKGFLVFKNGDSTSTNITVVTPETDKYGNAVADIVVASAAGATTLVGPFTRDLMNTSDKLVHITYSKVTSLTVAAVTL